MEGEPITDYSPYSQQELEALLCQELSSADPGPALAILEALESCENTPTLDTDRAWKDFNRHYRTLERPLYAEETARPRRRWLRQIGGIGLAACLACMLAVQAGGMDVLGTMVTWTRDQMFLRSPDISGHELSLLPEAGSQDAAIKAASSSAPGAEGSWVAQEPVVTDYSSLEEGLAAMDLGHLLPSVFPEGYHFTSAQVHQLTAWRDLSVHYENDAGDLLRFSCSRYSEDTVFSTVVEKDEEEVEILTYSGTTCYFLSNGPYESVTWMEDELTECRISGHVTREELKAMVESMHT